MKAKRTLQRKVDGTLQMKAKSNPKLSKQNVSQQKS